MRRCHIGLDWYNTVDCFGLLIVAGMKSDDLHEFIHHIIDQIVFNSLRAWAIGGRSKLWFSVILALSLFSVVWNVVRARIINFYVSLWLTVCIQYRVTQATVLADSTLLPPPVGGCQIEVGVAPTVWAGYVGFCYVDDQSCELTSFEM